MVSRERKEVYMNKTTKQLIWQTLATGQEKTVKPQKLNFCIRAPLSEERLTVEEFVLVMFFGFLRYLPRDCNIKMINRESDGKTLRIDELCPDYTELCKADDDERNIQRSFSRQDWKEATAFYYFKHEGPYLNFSYRIIEGIR